MPQTREDTSRFVRSVKWLYHGSGIASLYATGRDSWFVICARSCRMFAFGGVSLILAPFFAILGFTDTQIGLFMTLTLAGDLALSFLLTMTADSLGRRRVLVAGGLLMALSGAVFVYFENFWILLFAAIIGVVSATGGDFGPFRAIEESMLSHLTNPKTRSDVLSWYVTISGLGSAAGILSTGQVVEMMRAHYGWAEIDTYHAIFWVYIATGVANMVLALLMSDHCEINTQPPERDTGSELAQGLLDDSDGEENEEQDKPQQTETPPQLSTKKSRFSSISAESKPVMYKLWFLLTVDSLADGMVSYTLTNYYLDRKFHLAKSALGDFMSANYLLGAMSTVLAGPLARWLGLINTMVFTHLPSSAAVLLFPAPKGITLSIILLFIRGGLNNMDQAPRTAFIAAVIKPDERTAVMGITSMLRTLASAVGPTITGSLAETDKFWIAFVAAGALRIAYDLGLWAMFVNMKLYTHEDGGDKIEEARRSVDEEASIELHRVQGESVMESA